MQLFRPTTIYETIMFLLKSLIFYLSRSAWFHFKPRSRSVGQCTYTSFFIKLPCLFSTSRSMRVNVLPSLFPFFIYLFLLLLFICCFVLKLLSERTVSLPFGLSCLFKINNSISHSILASPAIHIAYSKFVEVRISRPNLT